MKRNYAIDFIKGLGLLLIAGLHINLFNKINYPANFIFNTVMRFAVPFFFVTSGYLLFNKLKGAADKRPILNKYFLRMLKYYICGELFCLLYDYLCHFVTHKPIIFVSSLTYTPGFTSNFFGDLFYYGLVHYSSGHLWFLIAMVWSALILLFVCRNGLAKFKALTAAALAIHLVGLFGLTQPYSQLICLPLFPREALFFALFYLCVGGYWALYGINVKKYIPDSWLLPAILLFSLLQLGERTLLVFAFDAPWHAYWGEYFVMTIPLTIVIFQYALVHPAAFQNNFLTKVGAKSLGVYILHNPILVFIRIITIDVMKMPELWTSLWFQLTVPVAAIVVSYYVYTKLMGTLKKLDYDKSGHNTSYHA